MTAFWALWNAAEKGDTEAAHQVNVLVAKRAGYEARLTKTPMYSKKDGTLIQIMERWSVYALDGKRLGLHERASENEAWRDIPDCMGDLNAAAGLVFPAHGSLDIYRNCDNGVYQDWRFTVDGDFKRIICMSPNLAHALVGAWWSVTTGEKQLEPKG